MTMKLLIKYALNKLLDNDKLTGKERGVIHNIIKVKL